MTKDSWQQKLQEQTLEVRNYINGEYRAGLGDKTIVKRSPRDGTLLYGFSEGTAAEVDDAVQVAKTAFEDGRWSGLNLSKRQSVLLKLADLIDEHAEELALYETMDVGKPISFALARDIPISSGTLRNAAHTVEQLLQSAGSDGSFFSWQERGPIGVVAGIAGWNFPLVLACQKVAPALIMGNSIVLKPSEFTSLSACRLAELAVEAGVPKGVFNVVNGAGATVGNALSHHMDVDLLSFVGSSATGKKLMIASGQSNMKRLILECGGKSPYLVFDDCTDDLDFIADDIVDTAFPNQGAVCVASTRLLIQESLRDKLLPKIIALTEKITPADPLDPETTFGALIHEDHANKVKSYIESGQADGAKLLCGGDFVLQQTGGFYMRPAVFDNVRPQSKVAQEEIFGPVLSIMTFKDEAEAIQLANDSSFGLSSYVATKDVNRIHRLGKRIQAGSMLVFSSNGISYGNVPLYSEAWKQSGLGRRHGVEGLTAYSASTTVKLFHD